MKTFSTYEEKRASEKAPVPENQMEKVREIYKDIFLAAVIHPKLARRPEEPGQLVDELFCDWEFCHDLYAQIMAYTMGKKKIR